MVAADLTSMLLLYLSLLVSACFIPGAAFDKIYPLFPFVSEWGKNNVRTLQRSALTDPVLAQKLQHWIDLNKTTLGAEIDKILDQDAGKNTTALVSVRYGSLDFDAEKHFARALRAGLAIFFIESGISMEEHNLDPSIVSMFIVGPDQASGGAKLGQEWCRRSHGSDQKAVLIYGPLQGLYDRIDVALTSFKRWCPDTKYSVVRRINNTDKWVCSPEDLEVLFMTNRDVTAVLAMNDRMAAQAREKAEEILGPIRARSILVSGFDNDAFAQTALKKKQFFASVDQCHDCIIESFKLGLSLVEGSGVKTTSDFLARLKLPSFPLRSEVTLVASDSHGHLLSQLLPRYEKSVPAVPESGDGAIQLRVGIHQLGIGTFDLKGGQWEAEFWIEQQWQDKRLTWPSTQLNESISLDHTYLWNPDIHFANLISTRSIVSEDKAKVDRSGRITKTTKVFGIFTCDLEVAPYPYNIFVCSIDVGVYAESGTVNLQTDSSWSIAGAGEEFYEPERVSEDIEDGKAVFKFRVTQKPNLAIMTYALPAFFLDLISFSAFYLPVRDDSTGLSLTAVLAAIVLHMEAREVTVRTWLDDMLNICLLFQFLSFAVSLGVRRHVAALDRSGSWDASASGGSRRLRPSELHMMTGWARMKTANLLILAFGTPRTCWHYRLARRYIVPSHLVLFSLMCFTPWGGERNISEHPDHGFSSVLAWVSIVPLLLFLVLFFIKLYIWIRRGEHPCLRLIMNLCTSIRRGENPCRPSTWRALWKTAAIHPEEEQA